MKLLIVYATTEGQTRKIARFLFDRLAAEGHSVELVSAADAGGVALKGVDGAVLAGSVHAGRYQAELRDFAKANHEALEAMPTLFLSVSLAAAGEDEDDWTGLKDCVARFVEETGWEPRRVEHVAGAFRFGEYDFFKYWAMRWIAREKDQDLAPGEDHEYTDWQALGGRIDGWVEGLEPG